MKTTRRAGSTTCGESRHLPSNDAELVRRARRGDEHAYTEIVERYGEDLYRLACSLVGNAADAEDVVQETFSGAFARIRLFEQRSSVKTWLASILVRQAARCRRTRWRKRTVPLGRERTDSGTEDEGGGDPQGAVPAAKESDNPDARLDVLTMLDALEPIHREVIVLRELQGLSYDEIAEVLDVPRGTVESRLFRARRTLKEKFAGDY